MPHKEYCEDKRIHILTLYTIASYFANGSLFSNLQPVRNKHQQKQSDGQLNVVELS